MSSNVVTLGNYTHNSPPPSKEEYMSAIHGWIAGNKDALSREEIGAMQAFDRIDAQRKALLLGIGKYYRANPRADVVMGVYTIIMFMSDNGKGACTLGQAKIAEILNRSRQTVVQAMQKLQDAGLIEIGVKKAEHTPVIPRAVAADYNHLVWTLDAIISAPNDACDHGKNTTGLQRGHVRSNGQDSHVRSNGQVHETCPLEPSDHVRSNGHNFTKENSTTLHRAASVVAAGIATAISVLPAAAGMPPDPPAFVQPAKPSLVDLQERMMDAAGPALKNPAAYPKLLMTSELQRWLDNGCDFEADVLPTIRASSAKRPASSISAWGYFTEAIADAKAARTAPMPEGRVRQKSQASTWHDEQERALNFLFRK